MTVYTPTSERQAPATTHRQMWALGDYAAIAEELLAPLGPILVSTSGIRRGDRVLDVAAGSGNVSIPAAMAGGCRQRQGARAQSKKRRRRGVGHNSDTRDS